MKEKLLQKAVAAYGTPTYLFDEDILVAETERLREGLGPDIGLCYAMKANAFLTKTMAGLVQRIEVCSMGEFNICRELDIPKDKLFISGVMKKRGDLMEILSVCGGICRYTAESEQQFEMLNEWSRVRQTELRIYPRLEHGNQFGMDADTIIRLIIAARENPFLIVEGIHYFSGTQKRKVAKIQKEIDKLDAFLARIKEETGVEIRNLEYGSGLPVEYFIDQKHVFSSKAALNAIADKFRAMNWRGRVTIEMGRAFAGLCGYYLSAVEEVKESKGQKYLIMDGGSHQLNYDGQIRGMYTPHIYVLPTSPDRREQAPNQEKYQYNVCGCLCTGNDCICSNLETGRIYPQDVLAFARTGAYSITEGFALFLSHEFPAVLLYNREEGMRLVRERQETYHLNF